MEKNAGIPGVGKLLKFLVKNPSIPAGAGALALDQGLGGADILTLGNRRNNIPLEARILNSLVNFITLYVGAKKGFRLLNTDDIKINATPLNVALTFAVGKDYMINSSRSTAGINKSVEDVSKTVEDLSKAFNENLPKFVEAMKDKAQASTIVNGNSALPWVVGGLGLGALGLGGAALWKYFNDKKEGTKAEVTVPGTENDPYSSIKVQIPVTSDYFGNNIISGVRRGVRDLVRTNVKANSKKIDPETGKKIPYEEWVMKYGDEEEKEELGLDKTSPMQFGFNTEKAASQMIPPITMESSAAPPPAHGQGLPVKEKCRRPVPPFAPTMASRSIAPGGNDRAGYGSSKIMAILARKNARQSGAVLGEKPAQPIMQPKQAGFYIDEFDCNRLVKSASVVDLTARQEVSDIMNRIYNEDPSAWPYGLNIPGHDSVYLIRDKMTKQAAGFVGWQETTKNGKKIGSYSIGILPEYRHNGFAKEAVSKVLQIKSAGVDEVKAFIVDGNKPSERLANSLGVAIEKKF